MQEEAFFILDYFINLRTFYLVAERPPPLLRKNKSFIIKKDTDCYRKTKNLVVKSNYFLFFSKTKN